MEHSSRIIKVYLNIAVEISQLSYCKRSKVGALIIKDRNIISYGYNGTPTGFCNDCEENGITKPEVLHAESNAILKAGVQANGAHLFQTLSPCFNCCKLIKQSGISHVYFLEKYRDLSGLETFKIPYTHVTL